MGRGRPRQYLPEVAGPISFISGEPPNFGHSCLVFFTRLVKEVQKNSTEKKKVEMTFFLISFSSFGQNVE